MLGELGVDGLAERGINGGQYLGQLFRLDDAQAAGDLPVELRHSSPMPWATCRWRTAIHPSLADLLAVVSAEGSADRPARRVWRVCGTASSVDG
jgi:hypothetical protein